MSLGLLPVLSQVAPGRPIPFSGTGGTPPYAYSVAPGGAGGVIDPASGLYTAPAVTGIDTVVVTDSAVPTPATFTATVNIMGVPQLVCDIIANQLGLASDQVYLWNQKFTPPTDNRLYVVIKVATPKPFANNTNWNGSTQQATQYIHMLAMFQIDVFSRGPDARDRKEEVLIALASPYAKLAMTQNSFGISPLSTGFVDISGIDGAALPYHFSISVNVQYSITKVVTPPYYDTFQDAQLTYTEP